MQAPADLLRSPPGKRGPRVVVLDARLRGHEREGHASEQLPYFFFRGPRGLGGGL